MLNIYITALQALIKNATVKIVTRAAKARGRWIERQETRCRESANCRRERERVVIFYVDTCMREGQCCFCSCSVGPLPVPPSLDGRGLTGRLTARVNYNAGTWDDSEMCHTLAGWTHESSARFDVRCVGPGTANRAVSPSHFHYKVRLAFFLFIFYLNACFVIATNASIMHGVAILIAST